MLPQYLLHKDPCLPCWTTLSDCHCHVDITSNLDGGYKESFMMPCLTACAIGEYDPDVLSGQAEVSGITGGMTNQ